MAKTAPKMPRSVGPPILVGEKLDAEVRRLKQLVDTGSDREAKKAKEQLRRIDARREKDMAQAVEALRIMRAELVGEVVARLFDVKLGRQVRGLIINQTHIKEDVTHIAKWIGLQLALHRTIAKNGTKRVLPNLNDRKVFNHATRAIAALGPEFQDFAKKITEEEPDDLGDPRLKELMLGKSA